MNENKQQVVQTLMKSSYEPVEIQVNVITPVTVLCASPSVPKFSANMANMSGGAL